ncbi:MAG TPA: hypothetical protein VGB37_14555 [Candidatus Lokiarchaeia archaeon]
MLEKKMKKSHFRLMVYIFGCILELLGFALLFNSESTITFFSNLNLLWLIGIFIIFSGYVMAVAMRFKN